MAARRDLPQLAGAVLPVRVAGVDGAVGRKGDVVGLVGAVEVRVDADLGGRHVDAQHVVAGVVGHVHVAAGGVLQRVGRASVGEVQEGAGLAAAVGLRGHFGDAGPGAVTDDVHGAVRTDGRALEIGRAHV